MLCDVPMQNIYSITDSAKLVSPRSSTDEKVAGPVKNMGGPIKLLYITTFKIGKSCEKLIFGLVKHEKFSQCLQCSPKTFMVHQTFVRWALYILFKFVKSLIRHLGLAIGHVWHVRWFSWTLCLHHTCHIHVMTALLLSHWQICQCKTCGKFRNYSIYPYTKGFDLRWDLVFTIPVDCMTNFVAQRPFEQITMKSFRNATLVMNAKSLWMIFHSIVHDVSEHVE